MLLEYFLTFFSAFGINYQEKITSIDQDIVSWKLNKTYAGDTFFDGFYFYLYNGTDPTRGIIQYVDKITAIKLNLIGVENGKVRISVDSTNVYSGNEGRPSIRLQSNFKFNDGLFILDLDHMPTGPGTWPAWWLHGPQYGEIDVLEGISGMTRNAQTLWSHDGCHIPSNASISFKGKWTKGPSKSGKQNCYVKAPIRGQCSIMSQDGYFGGPFNDANGGVYALEWIRNESMKIWIFHRNEIPVDITSGNPVPSNWGKPQAFFQLTPNCIPDYFNNMEMTINTDLCGDWAGAAYPGGPLKCAQEVRSDPASYIKAYWLINYIKYFSR